MGASFDALDAEIGKVLAFAAGRGEVVEEDIRAVCVSRGAVDPFRLAETLVRKDAQSVPRPVPPLRGRRGARRLPQAERGGGVVPSEPDPGEGGAGGVTPGRAAEIFRALSRIDREMKGESRLSPAQVYEIRLLSLLS